MKINVFELQKVQSAKDDPDGVYRTAIEAATKTFAHAMANNLPFILFTVHPEKVDCDAFVDSTDLARVCESMLAMLDHGDVIATMGNGPEKKDS